MIFIGVSEKVVRNTYRDYGFEVWMIFYLWKEMQKNIQNPDGIFLKWRLRNVSLPMTASPSPR